MINNVELGGVSVMTDDEIDEFVLVSSEDIGLMRTTWQRYASPRYSDLVDAQPVEEVIDIDAVA